MTTATDLNQPTLQPAAPTGRRLSLPVLLLIIAGAAVWALRRLTLPLLGRRED